MQILKGQNSIILNNLPECKLTATKLRKHLATTTSILSQNDQHLISDFMGHGIEIHNNIYRQRQAHTDIVMMGKVLTEAMGEDKSAVNDPVKQSQLCTVPSEFSWLDNEEHEGERSGNYQDLSDIQEESELSSAIDNPATSKNKCKTRKKILTGSSLRNVKRSWRTPEKKLIRDSFTWFIENKKVPNLHECQDLIHSNSNTLFRSPRQVRSWILAEIKRNEKCKYPFINIFFINTSVHKSHDKIFLSILYKIIISVQEICE